MSLSAFQRLQRVLDLEEKQGWRNRAVIGGLGAMAARWEGDARAENAEQGAVESERIDAIVALLALYDRAAPEERPDTANTIRRTLAGTASAEEIEAALALPTGEETHAGDASLDHELPPAPGAPASQPPASQTEVSAEATPAVGPPEATHIARQRAESRKGPSPQDLDASPTRINGLGRAAAELLAKLNIHTIRDLLWHLPARYDDYSAMRTVAQVKPGEQATIIANLWSVTKRKIRHNREMLIGTLADATGTMRATWYNKWLEKQLKPESTLRFSGKVGLYMGHKTFENPVFEEIDQEMVATGRITPVYGLTEGLTNNRLRTFMRLAVDGYSDAVEDTLPAALRERYDLVDLATAIRQIHFPDDADALAAARRRIAFEEMLYVQLGVTLRRRLLAEATAVPMQDVEKGMEAFAATLPFALTGAQTRVLAEVGRDLARSRPMTRLIQGDVGSGKTAVAAGAMVVAARNGLQSALLAPTQILAEQHFRNLEGLLAQTTRADGSPLRVALLTGRVTGAARESLLAELEAGAVDVLVGTTALIQDAVRFHDLGLVVVDEQHRFGVEQRTILRDKGGSGPHATANMSSGPHATADILHPHMLVMSATPIPRSLALTVYGDLDLSIIDELPPGRKTVKTKIFQRRERERLYAFMQREAAAGRQAFIVYPLVEESDALDAGAATTAYAQLSQEIMPDLRLALLHGRMAGSEKDEVMQAFAAGEYDVLVSTTVIEVGIDVPNASTILIEDAERFGLAQLHQLRGRVGRGEHASYCALISGAESPEARQRLQAVAELDDGFRLAEKDLELRGPGEFLGKRQSGMPGLRYAELTDLAMIAETRAAAEWLLGQDYVQRKSLRFADDLDQYPGLAANVRQFWQGEGDIS